MTGPGRDRLADAIDRGRVELARAVQRPEDLGAAATIALSRRLDALIYLYLSAAPGPRRPT